MEEEVEEELEASPFRSLYTRKASKNQIISILE